MIEDITPSEFNLRCNAGECWQLLDVREMWEINIARVESSIDIPMNEIPTRYVELDTSLPIAVLCHSGGRSGNLPSRRLSVLSRPRLASLVRRDSADYS